MRRYALLLTISSLGCDRAPDPVREWSPQDHDQVEQPGQQAPPTGSQKPNIQQQLVESAWMQTCNTCHGPIGKGDGPQGSLVKAPDLTRPDWQAKVTDEEIAARIRSGKGLMPPNDLPDSTIKGLVARIRALRGQ
ncbi:MAG TPA: cytochrome c [Polyangiaceae bacterium]|nr:cytochrome c [Polyangiaceae bacterium]